MPFVLGSFFALCTLRRRDRTVGAVGVGGAIAGYVCSERCTIVGNLYAGYSTTMPPGFLVAVVGLFDIFPSEMTGNSLTYCAKRA